MEIDYAECTKPISEVNLQEKYVIMKTRAELNLDLIDRVYFCDSGFGCDPKKSGTKIYGYFVTDPGRVYMRRHDAIRLATMDEIKQAEERFRKNKTWALESWRKHQADKKKTFLEVMYERGGLELP